MHFPDRPTDRPTHGIGGNSVRIPAYCLLIVSDAANNKEKTAAHHIARRSLLDAHNGDEAGGIDMERKDYVNVTLQYINSIPVIYRRKLAPPPSRRKRYSVTRV